MANKDDAKPVTGGYDFGDDWLNELEEALDFDMPQTDAQKALAPEESHTATASQENTQAQDSAKTEAHESSSRDHEKEENSSPLNDFDSILDEVEISMEEIQFDGECGEDIAEEISIDTDEPETTQGDTTQTEEQIAQSATAGNGSAKPESKAVEAQVLDIADLQRELRKTTDESAGSSEQNRATTDDSQLWQFVSLIMMRLFDDLELIIVQKDCEECCDLMKQLNRLANILAFADMHEQLPLIAYIGNMMPISYTEAPIGEPTERHFDNSKMRHFLEKANEVLNCFVYMLTYFKQHASHFDTGRFSDVLERLYVALDAKPGQPSNDAPLPSLDDVNPHELTTRTLNKLARTLESLISESLHYLESAMFYGYSRGYEDAAKSIDNAAQIVKEYRLNDFENDLHAIYHKTSRVRSPEVPDASVFGSYFAVCDLLERHFSKQITERKLRHLRSLVSKFNSEAGGKDETPFCVRWQNFMKDALPLLEFEYCALNDLRDRVCKLKELSDAHEIRWLSDVFMHLDALWDTYPSSCAEAFVSLTEELRAFPTEDIEAHDVEQLNHDRLRVLFARKPDARKPSAYSVVNDARQLAEILLQQLDTPAAMSSARIYELLIDARRIHCYAIERCCEVLISLLERVPAREAGKPLVVSESVVGGLYFTAGLLQAVCGRLLRRVEKNPDSVAVRSKSLFYLCLMSLYQAPNQPRDGATSFIVKQVNHILNELQLVWVNTSTSTSTEYYCSLIRRLLHLATMCKLNELRQQLLVHLDEVPQQDFVNTENRMMQRQCVRIIRLVEDSCPRLVSEPCSQQVLTFFSKSIAAFNQLLSSRDMGDASAISAEMSRIEARMSILGMTTDFPPAIAFVYELHHLSYLPAIERGDIEDLLFHLLTVANNVCPEWVQPKNADLEFIRTSMSIPMVSFQEILESVDVVYHAIEARANEDPMAWEHAMLLRQSIGMLVGYLPCLLQNILKNAQNRCRYLKKNIYIDLETKGYPPASDISSDAVPPMIVVACGTIVEKLLEIIVDCAFLSTDNNSRIDVVLQPFSNEVSVSVFHNGKLFTTKEIVERLGKVNIVPAPDDNLFDLLVSTRRLVVSYPPVNQIAYILPLLRQFNGALEISDDANGNTRLYLRFRV